MNRGPFVAGDRVQLTDPKGRHHQFILHDDGVFHSHKGALPHNDLIGAPEGSVVTSSGGTAYVALRPLLVDYTLAMKRGAAVVYPKDAAQILAFADIFPGARVLEAGAGSGALACWMLRAIGPDGLLTSYERRADFAEIASRNVAGFFGGSVPSWWSLNVGSLVVPSGSEGTFDRLVLDMLAPWDCVGIAGDALIGGGLVCVYVATTTQLSRVVEEIRAHGGFDEPESWETLRRGWHVEGLAVRPQHQMIGHTGFLVTARRLAPGVTAPPRRRRPAKGDDSATE
jgi:tRNA (adenine57-N1/adenine58-N1)-methyltransferase